LLKTLKFVAKSINSASPKRDKVNSEHYQRDPRRVFQALQ